MSEKKVHCVHACRNTCVMLTEALREESGMVSFYERLQKECDYPDVHDMLLQLIESRGKSVLAINQKLNELSARAAIMDGVISSYERTET
jgi:predicted transglutaminase-like cysteine proteinase